MKKSCAALVFGLLAFASQLSAATTLPGRVMCPMIYQPSTCSYGEYSAEGGNKCFARAALVSILERSGVDYDPTEIKCVISDAVLSAASEDAAE